MKILSIDSIEAYGLEMQRMHFSLHRNLISIEHCGSRSTNIAAAPVKMLTMSLELTLVVLDVQPRLLSSR